jgi:hypothetical protein
MRKMIKIRSRHASLGKSAPFTGFYATFPQCLNHRRGKSVNQPAHFPTLLLVLVLDPFVGHAQPINPLIQFPHHSIAPLLRAYPKSQVK